jgi:hypothetical protein
MDMQPRRIPVAAIEQLQRAIESLPECQVDEVTKVQAIRMLVPQIQAMQSKGYSLGAIAKMFSENGIVVTAVTLKSYLNQVKPMRGRKGIRKSKQRRRVDEARSDTPIRDPRSAVPVNAVAERSGATEVRAASQKTETVAGEVVPKVEATAAVTKSPVAVRSGATEVRAASQKTGTVAGELAPKVEVTAGVTKAPKVTPRQADEGGARRSAFVPKEDTEDI